MPTRKEKFYFILRIIVSVIVIFTAFYSSIIFIGDKIVWQYEKEEILNIIREDKLQRKEEIICSDSTQNEVEYKTCMNKFNRERELRLHPERIN